MPWKILLPQEIMAEGRKLLEDAGHTIIMGRGFETEDVLADMKEYQPDAMIVRITPITREVIEANPNLKVIVRHGAGFDALDVKACHDNGVQTLYAPVANSTSVAETAILLMLEMSRNVIVLRKTWVDEFYKAKLKVRKNTLSGKTLGIVGYGSIGKAVAKIAVAFGMQVLVCATHVDPSQETDSIHYASREEIFAAADVITFHCPLFPETTGIVNKDTIAGMKDGVILINTARGPIVVDQDVVDAVKSGKIYAYAADVVSREPIPADNPLQGVENVILTPHIAWAPREARQRLMDITVSNLRAFLDGAPVNVVNP